MSRGSEFEQQKPISEASGQATSEDVFLAPHEAEAILDSDVRGICITDRRDVCRIASVRLRDLLGFSKDEMLGRPIKHFLPGLAQMSIESSEPSHRTAEYQLTRKDGGTFPARLEVRQLFAAGQEAGFAVFVSDLSEAKKTEELLQRTERLASAGRMAAAIAHEINNPLEAVTNLLFLLRSQELNSYSMHLLSLTESEIERVSRIARQTLAFYRESSRPTRVDLRELLNLSVDVHGMRGSGLKVHRRYRTSQMISGYVSELQQVFHNVISNSVEAGATELWIHTHQSNELSLHSRQGVRISIADNGSGIDPAIQSRIFHPFITTKGEKGTGLGLWVSRGIIVRHEGSTRVRTSIRPGYSGTCMSMFLPL